MKIAIFGYGKMGKAIETLLLSMPQHKIVLIATSYNHNTIDIEFLQSADVAIDFSVPEAVITNIQLCFAHNIPIVVGTTGWYDHLDYIKNLTTTQNQTIFYSSNYSIGVFIMKKLTQQFGKLIAKYPQYKLQIEETHHTEKKDSPSGTAITLAEQLIQENDHLDKWVNNIPAYNNELLILSQRKAKVKGIHEIIAHSDIDTITIRHEAHNRDGFAQGAIAAAEWVIGKKGVYNMDDMITT